MKISIPASSLAAMIVLGATVPGTSASSPPAPLRVAAATIADLPTASPAGAARLTYASSCATLAACDRLAAAGKQPLVLDRDWSLGANTTLSAPFLIAAGGVITRGRYSIAISGRIIADEKQQILDAAGTGAVTFATGGDTSVYWFGAVGDGAADDTNPSQAVIKAAGANGCAYFPPGRFKWVSTVALTNNRGCIRGSGRGSTSILFAPLTDDTALQIGTGRSATLFDADIRDLTFTTSDSTHAKVAIDIVDASDAQLRNINITATFPSGPAPYWTGGSGSIGLRTHGRDALSVEKFTAFADYPLVIAANPNASRAQAEDTDHFHFSDIYLSALQRAANPVVKIENGVNVGNLTFDGFQAWVGGGDCFQYINTTAMVVASKLSISNVRCEQGGDRSKYSFNIQHSYGLQDFRLVNAMFGSDRNGLYLRGVQRVTLEDNSFAGRAGSTALDSVARDGNYALNFHNDFWQAGSTATLAGYRLRDAAQWYRSTFPLPSTAVYGFSNNTVTDATQRGDVLTLPVSGSLAAGASAKLAGDVASGITAGYLRVSASGTTRLEGGQVVVSRNGIKLLSGTDNFAAGDTANKLSVVLRAGMLILKNNTAETLNFFALEDFTLN